MTRIEEVPPGQLLPDYWLFVPRDPLPGSAAPDPPPLVIFLPGFTGNTPEPYLAWIEHLARRGAVVLFADYQDSSGDEAEFRRNLLADVQKALETLGREGIAVDLSRVAVVGHSLGGVLAVDYAASAAAQGLPVPTAVMGIAASCLTTAVACLGADLGAIPATTRLLLVRSADDTDPIVPLTVERIWTGLAAVPLAHRDVVTLVTDNHVRPALLAVHLQALADDETDPPDPLDWYGTWKWLDALMACAFDGRWCEYALGDTPEQRFMGTWSDGVPVKEARVTDDPA